MYDPELPAGYQDADIEQADLERQGREAADRRRRGICDHGWQQGYNGARTPDLNPGQARCLDCGAIVPDRFAGR